MMEELLHILEKNARLPVEDIAAMMGKNACPGCRYDG